MMIDRPQSERKQTALEEPPIRYVQQYATDSDPDQPVQVKLLRWDGSGFVAYGTEFRVGDTSHAGTIGSGQQFFVRWEGSSRRWIPITGIGDVGPRFAIVTTEAEAASGTIGGARTPGVGEATLYTYGTAIGDDATAGDTIEFENYMEAAVSVGKPIFVSQRAGGIWVVHSEGCSAVPEE